MVRKMTGMLSIATSNGKVIPDTKAKLLLLTSLFIVLYPMVCHDVCRTYTLSFTIAYLPTTVSVHMSLFNR